MIHFQKKVVVGKTEYLLTFLGEDLHEAIMESKKVSFNNVAVCGLCGSDLLYLDAYNTKEDELPYTKVVCAKCRGSVTFGRTKKDGTLFLRKTEDGKLDWQKFVEKAKSKEWKEEE